MNLEAIEQEVLSYLKQVTNPLVRVDLLLERLRQKKEFSLLTEGDLLDFLRTRFGDSGERGGNVPKAR